MQSHRRGRASRACAACWALALGAALSGAAHAGPVIIEETVKLTSPDPSYRFGQRVAFGGDALLVTGWRLRRPDDLPFEVLEQAAFLFEKAPGQPWRFVRKLVEVMPDPFDDGPPISVAMRPNLAVVAVGGVFIFERNAAGQWIQAPSPGGSRGTDVELVGDEILVSEGSCSYSGDLYRKQAGAWTRTRSFSGEPKGDGCDDEFTGGDLDLTASELIIGGLSSVHLWNRPSGGDWPGPATAIVPVDNDPPRFPSHSVAIRGNLALASGTPFSGPVRLRRSAGTWGEEGNLLRPDRIFARRVGYMALQRQAGHALAAVAYPGDRHFGGRPGFSIGGGSVALFRITDSGGSEYVAKLLASDGNADTALGGDVEIVGRTILAGSNDGAYLFELPQTLPPPTPRPLLEDFEDRNAAGWTALPGSNFSIALHDSSLVYRQSSVLGDAGALHAAQDENQSIEADVVASSFSGSGERWFGLTVRQSDASNRYYLTMRNTNRVELRKLVGGAIQVLATAPLPVVLNRRYRLRLEAVGTRIRGYVDGRLQVEARDTSHNAGDSGVLMFKTRADYDNIVLSANPQVTLVADDFDSPSIDRPVWLPSAGEWNLISEGGSNIFLGQTSLAGDGRVVTRVSADDQAVQVRARAVEFAPGGARWFGVLSRYVDDRNFYYLTVRNDNTVSLRKLVNGSIVVLDSAALPVSTGTWYTLRLDALGSSLRGYVNGRLLLQANDESHPSGSYGFATFKTNARFDDVVTTQP